VFYLPKIQSDEIKRLEGLITRWGGIIVDFAEAKSFQIRPDFQKKEGGLSLEEFYSGNVLSCHWIEDSIKANHM